MTEMLKGIAASDGVAVAKAYLLVQPDLSFETVTVEDTNAEEARLDVASLCIVKVLLPYSKSYSYEITSRGNLLGFLTGTNPIPSE